MNVQTASVRSPFIPHRGNGRTKRSTVTGRAMTRVRCDRPVANSRSYLHPSCLITWPHSPVCAKSLMNAPRRPSSGSVFAGTHALATQAAWSLGNFTPVAASAVPLTASDATSAAAIPIRLTTAPPLWLRVPAAVFPIENTSSRARLVFWRVTPKAAGAPYPSHRLSSGPFRAWIGAPSGSRNVQLSALRGNHGRIRP
jgi:hypothetical protein